VPKPKKPKADQAGKGTAEAEVNREKQQKSVRSWRFHAGATSGSDLEVDYWIPARQMKASKLGKLGKKGPHGVDCYALGRLLSAVYAYGGISGPDSSMRTRAADQVSS